MKLIITAFWCFVFVGLLAAPNGGAQTNHATLSHKQILESLDSENASNRSVAIQTLINQRLEIVAELTNIIGQSGPSGYSLKAGGARTLCYFRASSAIGLLMKRFDIDGFGGGHSQIIGLSSNDLKARLRSARHWNGLERRPASVLCEQIGQTDDQSVRQKYVAICRSIDGSETEQFRLNAALQSAQDPTTKKRIELALNMVAETHGFDNPDAPTHSVFPPDTDELSHQRIMEMLEARSDWDNDRAFEKLFLQNEQLVKLLIKLIGGTNSLAVKFDAAGILGYLRGNCGCSLSAGKKTRIGLLHRRNQGSDNQWACQRSA